MGSTVAELRPSTRGYDLTVKVLESKVVATRKGPKGEPVKIAECIVGDETGTVVLSVRNEQVDKAAVGSFLSVRNAKVDMYRGSMRLAVDKASSLEVAEGVKFQPKTDNNMSLIEFEFVAFDTVA